MGLRKLQNGFLDSLKRVGAKTTIHRMPKPVKTAATPVATSTDSHKGYRLFKGTDGDWRVPELDRESVFDTKGDAKHFVDAWVHKNPAVHAHRRKLVSLRNSNPAAFDRCVSQLQGVKGIDNTYAVCTAAGAGKRKNPEAAAADLFEVFHGKPATHVEEVVEEVHEHDWLAPLGDLMRLRVDTESGYRTDIVFKRTGTSRVTLSSSEDGTTMYFVGGDQSVDLDELHMGGDKWRKDLMIIGRLKEFDYFTEKGFDKFIPTIYFHKVREGLTADGTRHTIVADKEPIVLYDLRSQLLQLAGGQYSVREEGVVG